MRNDLFRLRHKVVRMTTAALTLDKCHFHVKQMALPLIPQRRVKGAIEVVRRDCGLSYSKTRKIFYRLTDHILAFERDNIEAAFKRAVEKQERLCREQADRLAALRAECDALEGQHELTWPYGHRTSGADTAELGRTADENQTGVAAPEETLS